MDTKPTNPKDAIGSSKLPLHLWPMTATMTGSLALLDGALKYGRSNWREAGVKASIYYDALQRHVTKWFEGEEADPDSGLPHLAHALACLAILVDAEAAGKLTDDRMYPGGTVALLDRLTPHVERLKAKHAERSPKHYMRRDPAGLVQSPPLDPLFGESFCNASYPPGGWICTRPKGHNGQHIAKVEPFGEVFCEWGR